MTADCRIVVTDLRDNTCHAATCCRPNFNNTSSDVFFIYWIKERIVVMRIIKKYALLFLSLLICLGSFSMQISADDEDAGSTEQTYSASYEFVMNDGSDVPECLMALLPEGRTDLRTGDIIVNEHLDDVRTDDAVFSFVSWNHDKYTIDDSDITFIGTWKKTPVEATEPETTNKQEEEQPSAQQGKYRVRFYFIDNEIGTVPDEVMELLPKEQYVDSVSEIDVPDLKGTKIGRYAFARWDSAINPKTNEIFFVGVWQKQGMLRSIPYPGYDPDAVVTSQYKTYGISGLETGFFVVQYLNGQLAWCIEPWEHNYALPNTSYWITGTLSSRKAEIIWLGLKNGMSVDAIQAALWNYIEGGNRTVSSGENTDPDSSYYNSGGAYDCTGNIYETQDYGGTLSIQSLAMDVACTLKAGKLNLKKVSSDSNYPYGSYTNNYSLANAVYGVYSDQACTNQVYMLTTNANGDSNTLEFNNDVTYYVKEITPSKGFMIDSNIYTARVTRGKTTTITSKEDPYNDPVRIVLKKFNARHPERVKYLDEAEFTIKYYDSQEDDVSSLSAKKTWVFRPIYNESGEAEIILDEQHFVRGDELPLNTYGDFYLPLGTFTIQETKAPQTYQIDPNVYVGHIYREEEETKATINGGDMLIVENEDLTQSEREVIISTSAIFEENGEHRYVADGVAHIVDVVEYDYLIPGDYYKLKAKLMQVEVTETEYTQEEYNAYVEEHGGEPEWQPGDIKERAKTEIGEVAQAEVLFSPVEESGNQDVVFDGIDFDDRANTDYVVYEYLYHCEVEIPTPEPGPEPQPEPQPQPEPVVISEEQVTYHEDLYDEGQSVHVDELYRADFLLYKIGDGNRSIKLSGAYFDVKTHRVKRDGREVDHELGTFVTGGIYIPGEDEVTEFTVKLYSDPKPSIDPETGEEIPPATDDPVLVGEYTSELNKKFSVQAVTILGLDDGIYYSQINDENMKTWRIEKGMIFLPMQEEDTEITFTELIAPQGYYLESRPFVMSVGHDYELLEVENYRSNSMIIIPHTGYEG